MSTFVIAWGGIYKDNLIKEESQFQEEFKAKSFEDWKKNYHVPYKIMIDRYEKKWYSIHIGKSLKEIKLFKI